MNHTKIDYTLTGLVLLADVTRKVQEFQGLR